MLYLRTIVLVNFITCGLEFVSCAGFTYIPPLLRKAGHSEWSMALTMGLGPLLGFILVPYLGEASDNTKSRYGRRRPFIASLCSTAAICLFLIPYCSIFKSSDANKLMLTLMVIAFDFASQVALTPIEALLSDLGKPLGGAATDQIFHVYSFMIGIGGIFGYLITSINWQHINLSFLLPPTQEERVFSITVGILLISLVISMSFAKELPNKGSVRIRLDSKSDILLSPLVCAPRDTGLMSFIISCLPANLRRIIDLPKCLRKLCVAQFFSWSAVMSYNLFFTDFLGEGVFNGDPSAAAGPVLNERYDEGVRVGSWGLLVHCVTCCLFSLVQDRVQQRIGAKAVLFFSMLLHTGAVLLMTLTSHASVILVLSVFPGVALSALMSIPFTLVNKYHERHEMFLPDSTENRGIGTDLAIVDSMYFLAEFSLSVIDSVFVIVLGSTYAYMYATVLFGIAASVLILHTVFTDADMIGLVLPNGLNKTVQIGSLRPGVNNFSDKELPI